MPSKVIYDETGTGRHTVTARVEIGVLGVAGYGKERGAALAHLYHNLRVHLAGVEAALQEVEAEGRAHPVKDREVRPTNGVVPETYDPSAIER